MQYIIAVAVTVPEDMPLLTPAIRPRVLAKLEELLEPVEELLGSAIENYLNNIHEAGVAGSWKDATPEEAAALDQLITTVSCKIHDELSEEDNRGLRGLLRGPVALMRRDQMAFWSQEEPTLQACARLLGCQPDAGMVDVWNELQRTGAFIGCVTTGDYLRRWLGYELQMLSQMETIEE
jgi:hypothetical protein